MKKLLLGCAMLVTFAFFTSNIKAQGHYFELNGTLSSYNQSYKSKLSSSETDITYTGFSFGYNKRMFMNFYGGISVGYSHLSGDDMTFNLLGYTTAAFEMKSNVNLWTVSPKLTFEMAIGNWIYWTPNVYVTAGYGKTELDYNLGDISYFNFRFGLNPLSFDFRLLPIISINVTALTPYYNILSASFSNDQLDKNLDLSPEDKFVIFGGQIGVKLYF